MAALIDSLKQNLRQWDLGYWSTYDAHRTATGLANVATVAYHSLHCAQLQYLGSKLDEPMLSATAIRWLNRKRSIRPRLLALRGKLIYRMVEKPSSFHAVARIAPAIPSGLRLR